MAALKQVEHHAAGVGGVDFSLLCSLYWSIWVSHALEQVKFSLVNLDQSQLTPGPF